MNIKWNTTTSLLMLLGGSLLVGFSAGSWLAPLAAWLGPVLIMRFSRDHTIRRGYPLVIIAYILAFILGFGRIWMNFGGLLAIAVLAFLYAILWSLPYLADRFLYHRLSGFLSTLIYPLAATSLEIASIYFNPMGTWGATGFTQFGNIALMQITSVTGMIGITFLMGWFASVTNWAWENRQHRGELIRGIGIFGVIIAAVLIFGFLRLNLSPTSSTDETIRVAGITAQSLNTVFDSTDGNPDPEELERVYQSHVDLYFNETEREAQAGAKIIVWPELSATVLGQEGESALVARAQKITRQNEIFLTLPLLVAPRDTSETYENKLLVIDPTGEVVLEHIKYGGSISEPGRLVGDGQLYSFDSPYGMVSGVICYDLDYPAIIRQIGKNSTGLLLVPSKDWLEIDPTHTQMAVFRAIENGTSLVRQTDTGLSIAVDPYGRVLAETDFFGSSDRTMVAQMPVKHIPTIYSRFGTWFEALTIIGLIFLIIMAYLPRRSSNNE